MSLDSINEKIRQRITAVAIWPNTLPILPLIWVSGRNAAIVVITPNVAGVTTLLTPRTVVRIGPSPSSECSSFSFSEYIDSPMTMASSTTTPSTMRNPNADMTLIDKSRPGRGKKVSAPAKEIGMPIATQKAKRKLRKTISETNTKSTPIKPLRPRRDKRSRMLTEPSSQLVNSSPSGKP